MAQPRSYTRQFNFTDFQTASPSAPLPAVQVDAELNTAKLTLDDLNGNIGLIQRDDGKLRNNSVHTEAFDATSLALMNAGEINPKGSWAASTAYAVNDLVNYNASTYLCLIAHTSTPNFLTDQAAGKWNLLANAAIGSTAAAVDKFEGNGTLVTFTLTYIYTSNTDVLVFVNGALRNPGDDYTVAGNQITFVTAPSAPSVAGNENVIIWGPSVATQAAKDAAEAALDAFDDRYLGNKSSAPTVDNDGNALITGSLYFDTVANVLFNWTGSAWERIKPTTAEQAAINTVNTDIANVNTVATSIANVNTIAPEAANINRLGTATSVANMNSIVTNINDVDTVANLLGTVHFAVTVASGYGGGGNKFYLNGTEAPVLTLNRGFTYTFDVSNASVGGHPLIFKNGSASYTSGITVTGVAGQANSKVVFIVPANAPLSGLKYSCSVHGDGMGNVIGTQDNPINVVAANSANITTVASNISTIAQKATVDESTALAIALGG